MNTFKMLIPYIQLWVFSQILELVIRTPHNHLPQDPKIGGPLFPKQYLNQNLAFPLTLRVSHVSHGV
jgi:hypothetical protein